MAAMSNAGWRTVVAVAAVALIIFLVVSGQLMWGGVLLVLLLALGSGAMLYRKAGPPRR